MKRKSFSDQNCTIARTLEVVGEWWTLLVIREAFLGVKRFDAFQERLGIARNVLATRLRRLVRHGILEKRRYQERPRRHEYHLSEKGLDLFPVIVALKTWGDRWACPRRGPPVLLADRETRAVLEPTFVCGKSGRPLSPRTTWLLPGPGADSETVRRLTRG